MAELGAALLLHALADALNALSAAVLLGVVVRALHPLPGWVQAGTTCASSGRRPWSWSRVVVP